MSTFVVAMPDPWRRVLAPALTGRGHTVVDANAWWFVDPPLVDAATIDLRKALACTTETPLRREQEALCERLPDALGRAVGVYSSACAAVEALPAAERTRCVLLTTCTYDPPGRALAAVARRAEVPLVHLAHACQAGRPDLSWYAGETPGDWLLVPGDRDAAWWEAACRAYGTRTRLVVTGHPFWDEYAALEWRPKSPPRIVWLAESGANATMSRDIWESRQVPQRAWAAFLDALAGLTTCDWSLSLKTRQGEDPALVTRWTQEARERLLGRHIVHSDARLQEVLPTASVVVGQDSNGLVEAAHLGIPSVSITRRGGALFSPDDPVLVLDGEQSPRDLGLLLAARLADILHRPVGDRRVSVALQAMARRFNAGTADGQSLARTVAALEQIAAAPSLVLEQSVPQLQKEIA